MAVGKSLFGVEIEVEGEGLPSRDSFGENWRVTGDGSLRGESGEYLFASPLQKADASKALVEIDKVFRRNKIKMTLSDRCGVHIHVNVADMTKTQLSNFITAYLILEDALVLSEDEDRHDNLFCQRASSSEFIFIYLSHCFEDFAFYSSIIEENFKYAALNLYALRKFGSLEFRFFKTPSDFRKIIQWIEMLDNIREFSLKFTTPPEIIQFFSANGANDYMKACLQEHSNQITIDNFHDILWTSMRNVQAVAYSFKVQVDNEIGPPIGRRAAGPPERVFEHRQIEGRTYRVPEESEYVQNMFGNDNVTVWRLPNGRNYMARAVGE